MTVSHTLSPFAAPYSTRPSSGDHLDRQRQQLAADAMAVCLPVRRARHSLLCALQESARRNRVAHPRLHDRLGEAGRHVLGQPG